MNTSIFKNLSDVVLTSNAFQIRFFPGQEGNYTCVASNTYGSDERYFFVAFKGKTVPMISLTNHRFVSLRSKTSVYKYSCISLAFTGLQFFLYPTILGFISKQDYVFELTLTNFGHPNNTPYGMALRNISKIFMSDTIEKNVGKWS